MTFKPSEGHAEICIVGTGKGDQMRPPPMTAANSKSPEEQAEEVIEILKQILRELEEVHASLDKMD